MPKIRDFIAMADSCRGGITHHAVDAASIDACISNQVSTTVGSI